MLGWDVLETKGGMVVPKRKNTKNFTDIGSVLQNILPRYRSAASPALMAVWEIWDQSLGPDVAANARPAACKGDLLLIHVANSAWLHHLRLLQEEIIEKLNLAMGTRSVRELKFKIGPV